MKADKLEPSDIKLLKLIYGNPDLTYSELAAELKTSTVTIHNRIKKMKEKNIFKNTILIPPIIFQKEVKAFILVSTTPGREKSVAQQISSIPEVLRVTAITGDFDLIVEVVAADIDELQSVIMDRIRGLVEVVRTNTIIELFSVKDEASYLPSDV